MKLNNTWINHEDEVFVRFTCFLELPKNDYLKVMYDLNKAFHELTFKHELLMTLSPEYCSYYGFDYIGHYNEFLEKNKTRSEFFPTQGYDFYGKETSRVSRIFFKNQSGELTSSYVHYIQNGPSGNPQLLSNDKDIKTVLGQHRFFYDASPLSVLKPTYIKEGNDGKNMTVSFTIESHCSFWLDVASNFKYFDENNRLQLLEFSDNRSIAYANTPRLNSFFRDIRLLVEGYNGYCQLYDSKSLLSFNNGNQQTEALERMGIKLDDKIIYQEDIDERRVTVPQTPENI